MTFITDEMKRDAILHMEVAPDILFWTEAALVNRGETDADHVIPALLAAAWHRHKEIAGADQSAPFARLLRGWADSIDAIARPS
jgi:hypothetical protein